MGKIMLDTSFPNNPAWLEEGGPNAMALHLGALAYSDQHGLDGVIPSKVVPHVSLAVSPGDIESALEILLEYGFWAKMSRDKYAIQNYERTNFTREQSEAFREREATKKRRQRLHSAGDHSLCTSARWCPAVKDRESLSPGDSTGTRPGTPEGDTRGSIPSPYKSIRPLGSMDGMDVSADARKRRRGPAKASAGAPATASPGVTPEPPAVEYYGEQVRQRWHPDHGWISATWLECDPWDLSEGQFLRYVPMHAKALAEADEAGGADTLDGLIPADA